MNLVFLASKGIQESYLLLFELDKPCGKLALAQNCIKIISDKSNSAAMLLRIKTDIEIKCHIRATFSLKYRGK